MGRTKGSSSTPTRAYSPKTARQKEAITKRRGELAELAFLYKAASQGFGVAKPYGDSERYDFILDCPKEDCPREDCPKNDSSKDDSPNDDAPQNDSLKLYFPEIAAPELARPENDSPRSSSNKLWRVQVKSTTTLLCGLYRINAHRRTVGRAISYQPSEVDFLAGYVIPEDAWFIFPIHDILDRTSLLLSPRNWPRPNRTDRYREAWHLFRPPERAP